VRQAVSSANFSTVFQLRAVALFGKRAFAIAGVSVERPIPAG